MARSASPGLREMGWGKEKKIQRQMGRVLQDNLTAYHSLLALPVLLGVRGPSLLFSLNLVYLVQEKYHIGQGLGVLLSFGMVRANAVTPC